MENVFSTLNAINVNDYVEKKDGLSYVSWTDAWREVKKVYPSASYEILKDANGLPYVYDELTGYMVFTSVTIEGQTHDMWLPVMDGKNKAMKSQPYEYATKYGKKTVDAATMFDINKTIMRCLVKNLAMFGLGLYIYAGEDLPEGESTPETPDKAPKQNGSANTKPKAKNAEKAPVEANLTPKERVMNFIVEHNMTPDNIAKICKAYRVNTVEELTDAHCNHYINHVRMNGGII